jgi:hypothetical protein
MWLFFAIFVNCFVDNVSATVFLRQKRASKYQDSDPSPRIRQRFFQQQQQQQAGLTRYSPNTPQGRHPNYSQKEATQRKKSWMPRPDPQKTTRKAAVTVNITRQRAIIGQ